MKPAALDAKLRRNLLRPNLILRPQSTALIKEQAMNISYTKRILAICAYIGFSIYGLCGSGARGDTPKRAADKGPRQRAAAAPDQDHYFYDPHVSVPVEKGGIAVRRSVMN